MTKNVTSQKTPGEPSNDKDDALPSKAYVLHRQKALTTGTGEMFDVEKKRRTKKGKTIDALAREDTLSLDSRRVLQDLAKNFVKSCFSRSPHSSSTANRLIDSARSCSVPVITAKGHKIRASEDYRKGQPASPLHYQMVPGVLPPSPREGENSEEREQLGFWVRRGGYRPSVDSMGSQTYA